jgi:hypothetical protein
MNIQVEEVFKIEEPDEFNDFALKVFQYQATNNTLYRKYLQLLRIDPGEIQNVSDIPFLPIGFFKTHRVYCAAKAPEAVFLSSATTGSKPSRHHIANLSLYRKSFLEGFRHFYGDMENLVVLALLPSYLERQGSSLVYMVQEWIRESGHPEGGFFVYNHNELVNQIHDLESRGKMTLLLGVSFALLDLVDNKQFDLNHTLVMETGGMKGRRDEITRMELHERLMKGFGVETIHSEYGMTELLSQAYSKGEGRFDTPPWMRIVIRDQYDPFRIMHHNITGGINVIDLANVYSCAFIETEDLGRLNHDGSFEILGRFDSSEVRGCNLMIGQE